MRVEPPRSHHLLKAPPLSTVTMAIKFHHESNLKGTFKLVSRKKIAIFLSTISRVLYTSVLYLHFFLVFFLLDDLSLLFIHLIIHSTNIVWSIYHVSGIVLGDSDIKMNKISFFSLSYSKRKIIYSLWVV